jgi:hypothetical protein
MGGTFTAAVSVVGTLNTDEVTSLVQYVQYYMCMTSIRIRLVVAVR